MNTTWLNSENIIRNNYQSKKITHCKANLFLSDLIRI